MQPGRGIEAGNRCRRFKAHEPAITNRRTMAPFFVLMGEIHPVGFQQFTSSPVRDPVMLTHGRTMSRVRRRAG